MAAHLAGLALLLMVLVPFVGTSSSFLSDEGAAIIQARSLAEGRGWIVPPPMPAVDPDGRHYPLVNSTSGPQGFAPLAKHPAYSVLVAGAGRMGGVAAMMLLSIIGTVASAGVAGALARQMDRGLERPAIWIVGLASPLFFDGFLVMGHTLGAALAGAAVLCAVVAMRTQRIAVALAVAPCVGAAVLLRNEAHLFAVSLAIVALVAALRSRPRVAGLVVAAGAVAGAAVARAAEAAWIAHIVGGEELSLGISSPAGAHEFLRGRFDGFLMTWLLPDYGASQPFSLLLLMMVVGLVVAAIGARSASPRPVRVLAPAAVAVCAALAALAAGPDTLVPGLLMAFPLVGAALVVLRRAHFRDAGVTLALATSTLFALGVLATQYPTGGTGEWGGRYFALAIPVFVPVLLLALRQQGSTLPAVTRRGAAGALIACSAVMTVMALLSVRSSHQYWDGFVSSVEQAEQVAGPGRPVVSTWSAAPRHAWRIFDRSPWLLSQPADVEDLRASMARLGIDRFVFVTVDLENDRQHLAGLDVIWADGPLDRGRHVLVVAESGGPR